ncbi:MAG TPA: 3-oxoacyl-[acyl-carrier-protein] reductase [Bryobacteraceae bacterium]|nr:3-oxoacyl-[acyl-carrier-protein] reductase [Bryobacteraceae bacterium]
MFNRVAFVTGASRGIGRASALALAGAGYDLVAAATAIETNGAVMEELRTVCPGALFLNLDLRDVDSIKSAFARALKEKNRIDVLVNNAGITRDGLSVRMKADDWNSVLQVNLSGAFLAIQQVLPGMMRNRWGRVINISSVVGQAGSAGQANYAASKAGMIGMTKALAQEMGSRGITVNVVAPGYIETDMTKDLPAELKQKILSSIPLGRIGSPEEVAGAVRFLAGDDAAYITGHVLAVNGGMYM